MNWICTIGIIYMILALIQVHLLKKRIKQSESDLNRLAGITKSISVSQYHQTLLLDSSITRIKAIEDNNKSS